MKKILVLPLLLIAFSLMACNPEATWVKVGDKVATNEDQQLVKIYNLYIADGGYLSYSEWLASIKGQQGDDGVAPTITIGRNGNYYVNGIDTGVKSKGEQGNPGEPGNDALTPYQIYVAGHPEYTKNENEWYSDVASGRLGTDTFHNVKFSARVADSGINIPSQQVLHREKAVKPNDPAIEGYTFICWTYQNEPWSFNSSVTENMTLVAQFE